MSDAEGFNTTHANGSRQREAEPEYLTARQLAAILQVSESTIYKLAREARIPSVRLTARLVRFNLRAVRKALEHDSLNQKARVADIADSGANAQLSIFDLLA